MRPTRPARRIRPCHAVDEADQHGVDLARASVAAAERALRPDRAPAPTDRHAARIAVVRERVEVPPGPAAEQGDEQRLVELRDLADGADAAAVELLAGHRPDAPEPLDRQRVEERELAVGRHDEQPVRLGDAARDLGQELRPRNSDGDRQADLLEHAAAQPARDLDGRPGRSLEAADVEERLVDREPLDERRRVLEHRGRRPCSPPSTPPCAAGRRPRRGRAAAPASRPSPCARRAPSPRSSRRARPRRRRSRADRAAGDRRAARPTRRTHRGRRAGSGHGRTRTSVRILVPHTRAVADGQNWRPTGWQLATGVLALAVIGLTIWGVSMRNDHDDVSASASAQIDELEQQLADSQAEVDDLEQQLADAQDAAATAADDAAAAAEEAAAQAEADLAAAQAQYEEVSKKLGAAKGSHADSQAELDALAKTAASELADAEAAAASSQTAAQKAQAQADAEKARADLAEACLTAVAEILGRVYESDDPVDALVDAADELEELAAECAPA